MPFLFVRMPALSRSVVWIGLVTSLAWACHGQTSTAQERSTPAADADPVTLIARAAGLLQRGNAGAAEPLLREALRLDPRSGLAHTYLGQVLLGGGRAAAAMDEFEAVLAYEPSEAAAREGERAAAEQAALHLRAQGKNQAALSTLQHALGLLPDDTMLLIDFGVQAESMHQLPDAGRALARALELHAADPRALYALARVEGDQGRTADAEKHFGAYLEQRPGDASAHYGLGQLYQTQQQTEAAKAEFKRSLELQPAQTESHYQLGQMALDAGEDGEARTQFAVVLRRLPTHGGALTGLGILDFRAHQYEAARSSLERAVASSPNYQPARYYLGLTLKRLGQTVAAVATLKRAAELAAQQQGKGQPVHQWPAGHP